MIVDDEPDIRRLLRESLELEGYTAMAAVRRKQIPVAFVFVPLSAEGLHGPLFFCVRLTGGKDTEL